jgi:spore germination protein KC
MTGCTQIARSKIEIDDAIFVRVLSIDKGEKDNVKVTITSKNATPNSSDAGPSIKQSSYSISAEGKTLAEAVRSLWSFSDRRPYYGHAEFILIGEDAAKEGLLKYIDYVSRDHQFRHSAKLYIVKGSSASSLVENAASGDLFIADRLKNLESDVTGLSISSVVTLAEAMFIFDNPNVSTFIPCLEQVNRPGMTNDKDNTDIQLNGYAIFQKDKLNRYLQYNESRGINWIKNRIASGMIIVKGHNGEDITLEIINSHTVIKPKITKDKLTCDITVNFNTNIDEITAPDEVFNKSSIDSLVQQQEDIVKKEVENVLNIAQKSNLDFFGIIQEFHMKYPVMWKDIEKNWSELFPEISFNVMVDSKINRSYLIKEPTGTIK